MLFNICIVLAVVVDVVQSLISLFRAPYIGRESSGTGLSSMLLLLLVDVERDGILLVF